MPVMKLFRFLFIFVSCFCAASAPAQNIHSVKLYRSGDQTSFPLLQLSASDALELHFDDLDADIKNYYYAFELRNWDWSPSMLRGFEYTRGFQSVRITTYRASSLATTRYTHYQASVPDRNATPTKSGNYLLKVFLNGDTSKTVFTRRFVVVESKANLAAQVQQPFNSTIFRTHHKLQIGVNTGTNLSVMSPSDLKIVVLQNRNWTSAITMDRPAIFRGNYYEYSDEAVTAIPAGREMRWADLRSLRLQSDRVQDIQTSGNQISVALKPDAARAAQAYVYYADLNGAYTIETLENVNPYWQSDYATVRFTYFPPQNQPLAGKDLYLFGELTNWASDTSALMRFNEERGGYEKMLLLKQGYYNYQYVTMPAGKKTFPDWSGTEGNFWNTENTYTILVYYRPFGARADELIGTATVSSVLQRSGL